MSRVAVLSDGGYLDHMVSEEFPGNRIDLGKLSQALVPPGKELLRHYHYACPPHQSFRPTVEERDRLARFDRYAAKLQTLPRFELRLGALARREDSTGNVTFEQKLIDVMLAVDLVQLASRGQISEAVILAGDSDFIPAVTAAKAQGVLVRVYHGRAPHRALVQVADECQRIDSTFMSCIRRVA